MVIDRIQAIVNAYVVGVIIVAVDRTITNVEGENCIVGVAIVGVIVVVKTKK